MIHVKKVEAFGRAMFRRLVRAVRVEHRTGWEHIQNHELVDRIQVCIDNHEWVNAANYCLFGYLNDRRRKRHGIGPR